jgi:hypothetical protein
MRSGLSREVESAPFRHPRRLEPRSIAYKGSSHGLGYDPDGVCLISEWNNDHAHHDSLQKTEDFKRLS